MHYFPLIFLLGGLFGMAMTAPTIFTALRCRNWPRVMGKIESRGITHDHTSHGDNDGGDRYIPFATYVYSVEGQEYHGQRISFGDHGGSSKYAEKAIERLGPSMNVEVFYDPMDPSQSVLDTKFGFFVTFPFLICTLFFILSLLCMMGIIGKK
jgi:hypothetical protein